MADFTDEIKRQSTKAFSEPERQGLRYMLELFHIRGRFWGIFWKWVSYVGGGIGAALAALTFWEKLGGGH